MLLACHLGFDLYSRLSYKNSYKILSIFPKNMRDGNVEIQSTKSIKTSTICQDDTHQTYKLINILRLHIKFS